MPTQINYERLLRIDQLIRMKATGTPQQLADKLGISKRMVHEYILVMKDLGGPIYYCKSSLSYLYRENVRFKIKFEKIV